jgi:hypothetical protein
MLAWARLASWQRQCYQEEGGSICPECLLAIVSANVLGVTGSQFLFHDMPNCREGAAGVVDSHIFLHVSRH